MNEIPRRSAPRDDALTAPSLPPGSTVWAAFSGGLDSTVLLHRLRHAGLPVKALHVNHHLQPAANRWVEHCREVCTQLDVPIYILDVKVDPNDPGGPEAAARGARYEAFQSVMRPGDCLATAHHQDDQAETVLLRLLRGAGVAGLAAMRSRAPFAGGTLWRPLLRHSRASLREYAERHALSWIEDPHNLDPRYSRSFLRNEIFPRFAQRWPQAIELLARTAEHCADAVELLDQQAAQDFKSVMPAKAGIQSLSVQRLLELPRPRRNNLLRFWAAAGGHELPPFDALSRLEREVLRARPDSAPQLAWGGTELRRFRDSLYLMPRLPPAPAPGTTLEWDGRADLKLPPGCGEIKALKPAKSELPLRVVFARGGERLKPAGSRFTRTLRNLFQEEAIPPWIRERLPLVELDGDLAAVADRWETAALKQARARAGCRYEWRHDLPGDPA
ncbi:MAG: tRNA lysidine(34) synthetase TilS [Gammaproteobacteria bacterium]